MIDAETLREIRLEHLRLNTAVDEVKRLKWKELPSLEDAVTLATMYLMAFGKYEL